MNAVTHPAPFAPVVAARVDQMYTVGHAARTARALGVLPSVLLAAFLGPLEDLRRGESERTA